MFIIDLHEAKTHLSQLIDDVLMGEQVVIAKAGKPLVIMSAYREKPFKRTGGQFKGIIKVSDDFDESLPDEIIKSFRGE